MACKVSLQSSLATLIAISVANSGNGSVQVAGRCIAYVRPATRIPSTLLHLVPMPAWEQRKLGELSSEFQSGDFISAEEILGSGPYPVYGGNGLRGYAKQYNHDGFYALIGRQGALCGNVNTAVGKAYFTEHAVAIKANSLHDTRFLVHLLRCMDLGQYSGQSAQPGLAVGVLKEVETTVPSKAEQQTIGSFFSRLDSLITLHQRKYDKLVIFKKSMLEKMFPKDGESVPEIRFAGFTDPWEQRKLENLASFGGGHTPSMADASNYVDGKILWVTSQDVKQHYIENTTTMISEKGAATLTLYPSDSIVIVARSGILRHTIPVAKLRKPATVNQDIKVIQTVDSCDSSWLLQYFIASNKTLLREYGKTGTTVESIDFAKMKSTALMVPYIEEQQAIGSFFSRLDNLITLHQRKLELLQDIKKSLLDKMFV